MGVCGHWSLLSALQFVRFGVSIHAEWAEQHRLGPPSAGIRRSLSWVFHANLYRFLYFSLCPDVIIIFRWGICHHRIEQHSVARVLIDISEEYSRLLDAHCQIGDAASLSQALQSGMQFAAQSLSPSEVARVHQRAVNSLRPETPVEMERAAAFLAELFVGYATSTRQIAVEAAHRRDDRARYAEILEAM
ncbi:MAG: hypothetical protein CL732_00690 [Chloroflexi bacterium]|nr:hypothetical protein [Chloroflexota bacterium]